MSTLVLDCSVTMAWCFEDECDRYADLVLGALEDGEALVPSIWPFEVANVLLVGERRKRLARADSARFVELLGGLSITVEEPTRERVLGQVLSCGRGNRLSAYDAAYLELAMRHGIPLATRDRGLRAACRRSGTQLFSV